MAKIELSLTSTYLRQWGLTEAIREVLQNAMDADVDGKRMTVEHDKGKLIVCNAGVRLEHNVFLLGSTGKANRSDQAGQFGEGLKLAMLVCAREGINMVLRNGGEVWEPKIEKSEKFAGEDVLVIHIRGGNKNLDRFQVEIEFPEETWNAEKWRYLFVDKRPTKDVVHTTRGRVLLGEQDRGKLFVRGIFVCHFHDMRYGYDFDHANLDRDRRVLASYEVREKCSEMLRECLSQTRGGIGKKDLWDMMSSGAKELAISEFDTPDPKLVDQMAAEFEDRYGDAIPVMNNGEAAELEHYGKRGVVLPTALGYLLRHKFGDVGAIRKSLALQIKERVQWVDLDKTETANLSRAIDTLRSVEPVTLSEVDVAVFLDGRLRGMFKDNRVLLARHILQDEVQTLSTLIHEVAHRKGGDGEKSHVAEIERLWREVYRSLTNKS